MIISDFSMPGSVFRTVPIAEEKGGVAIVVDKHRILGITHLWFDDEQKVAILVLTDLIHKQKINLCLTCLALRR